MRLPGVADILDILIVAVLLYWIMVLVRGTRAERMLWGLGMIVIIYFISKRMEFFTLHWILNSFLASIVIIIIVVFQQDIRRALVQMGRPFANRDTIHFEERVLDEIARASISMSTTKMGGIIVIERGIDLRDFLDTGVDIDGEVSRELLLTIFNPGSPLHDGAVVVRGGRIAKAGCILPLTEKELTKPLGTRHRAAIGLSEETDALILVVSEKTGGISIVANGTIEFGVEPTRVFARLKEIVIKEKVRKGFMPWRARP